MVQKKAGQNFISALIAFLALAASTIPAKAQDDYWAKYDAASTIDVDHNKWTDLLGRYIVPGQDGVNLFQYGGVTEQDKNLLVSYISDLTAVDVPSLNRDEQFVYWANLYNAVTINLILDRYPVDSIRKIKPTFLSIGPWGMKLVTVAGRELTLDNIEHDILRTHWDDPRVHYAVNCASIGCPNLNNRAILSKDLDQTLDANARAYINHPRGARIDGDRLVVSNIYKWFREDFGNSEQGVIEHLLKFAEPELAEQLSGQSDIRGYEYDWALNDISQVMN